LSNEVQITGYVITKYVRDFKMKNNTNHNLLFVVCDYVTNYVCDFEMGPVNYITSAFVTVT